MTIILNVALNVLFTIMRLPHQFDLYKLILHKSKTISKKLYFVAYIIMKDTAHLTVVQQISTPSTRSGHC